MAAGGSFSGFSSTGVSPRPMLMGAPHNALRAFNAGVSLTLSVRRCPQAATPAPRFGGSRSAVSALELENSIMAHRPSGSAQTGMYPFALCCAGMPGFLCQGAITYARSAIAAGKGKPAAAVYAGKTLKPVMML